MFELLLLTSVIVVLLCNLTLYGSSTKPVDVLKLFLLVSLLLTVLAAIRCLSFVSNIRTPRLHNTPVFSFLLTLHC